MYISINFEKNEKLLSMAEKRIYFFSYEIY